MMLRSTTAVLLCLWFVGWSELAWAQIEPTVDLQSIRQQQPSFMVRVSVDRLSRQYREGDQLTLNVVTEVDANIYVLYEQADGQLFQVFPNSRQPNNRLAAQQAVQIPALDDLFRWRIGPPFGKETIKVIATDQPLRALGDPKLKAQRFNPIAKTALKGIALELGPIRNTSSRGPIPDPPVPDPPRDPARPTQWAEADVEIMTSKSDPNQSSGGKRFGVFFGVSEHQFAAYSEIGTGRSGNLSTPHADAKVLNDLMKDVGRLQESKTYTNADATKANLEKAVCEWLPSVSKPGDTVVIYYSGHGGQVTDDNGDETDGEDEFLVPHDYLGLAAVLGMLELEKQGKLPPQLVPILTAAKQWVAQFGPEQTGDMLIRQTCVTDDLFGHWLQKLDGRQVIVILDICHSGGFATQEKSLEITQKKKSFEFLDQELNRLKDIGQGNTALLTASSTTELSLVRLEDDLSVMTYYLVEVLFKSGGPVDLTDAHAACERGMEGYFRSDLFQAVNEKLRQAGKKPLAAHHPKLYNYIGKQLFLKQ